MKRLNQELFLTEALGCSFKIKVLRCFRKVVTDSQK